MTVQEPAAEPTASTATIDVMGVSKWYGSVVAVNDVSVQVFPGITGLLGPNGAGKTTLLHMVAGLATTSEGEIKLLPHAGPAMTFMIGVRFLTDHLQGDTYFDIQRPGQNLDRARAQFALGESMEREAAAMKDVVRRIAVV